MTTGKSHPLETDCETVAGRIAADDDFLLLDCRERDEHEFVHIDSATLVPMSEMQARIAELEPHRGREIVVYCHHGMRSLQVALWLQGQGFEKVQSLAGGIDEWSRRIDSSLPRY